jgi:hypothetical protein
MTLTTKPNTLSQILKILSKKKEPDGAKGFWFVVFPCPLSFRFAVKFLRLSLLLGMLHSFSCIFVP